MEIEGLERGGEGQQEGGDGARRPTRERKSVERMRSSYLSAPNQKKEGVSSAKKEGAAKRKSTEGRGGSGKKKRKSGASSTAKDDNNDCDDDDDLDVPLAGLFKKDETSISGNGIDLRSELRKMMFALDDEALEGVTLKSARRMLEKRLDLEEKSLDCRKEDMTKWTETIFAELTSEKQKLKGKPGEAQESKQTEKMDESAGGGDEKGRVEKKEAERKEAERKEAERKRLEQKEKQEKQEEEEKRKVEEARKKKEEQKRKEEKKAKLEEERVKQEAEEKARKQKEKDREERRKREEDEKAALKARQDKERKASRDVPEKPQSATSSSTTAPSNELPPKPDAPSAPRLPPSQPSSGVAKLLLRRQSRSDKPGKPLPLAVAPTICLDTAHMNSPRDRERRSSEANLYSICPIKDIESASIDDPVPSDGDDMISTTGAAEAAPGEATSASGPEEVTTSLPKQVAKPAAPPPKKVLPSFKIPKKASEGRPRSPDTSAGSEETGKSGSTSDLTPKSKSLQQYRACNHAGDILCEWGLMQRDMVDKCWKDAQENPSKFKELAMVRCRGEVTEELFNRAEARLEEARAKKLREPMHV